jgi:iron complex outermembrane receptor protein
VLLNGRRLAPSTSGSTVNLASIPLAAVERVEILTDGANTLYGGRDCRRGQLHPEEKPEDAIIEASYNQPRSSGGTTSTASISKGWGDLDKDGYNLLLSASHDESKPRTPATRLLQERRDPVLGQRQYNLYQLSSNSIPGNATVKYTKADGVPPAPRSAPTCSPPAVQQRQPVQVGNRCLFDYAATVEDVPGLKRDSGFGSLNLKINDNTNFFAEGWSRRSATPHSTPHRPSHWVFRSAARCTKNPSRLTCRVWASADATVTSVTMNLRLADAGGRADEYKTIAKHLPSASMVPSRASTTAPPTPTRKTPRPTRPPAAT